MACRVSFKFAKDLVKLLLIGRILFLFLHSMSGLVLVDLVESLIRLNLLNCLLACVLVSPVLVGALKSVNLVKQQIKLSLVLVFLVVCCPFLNVLVFVML